MFVAAVTSTSASTSAFAAIAAEPAPRASICRLALVVAAQA